MKFLTLEQLKQLTAQRRKALLRSVTATLAIGTDDYLDFEPDLLALADPYLAKVNEYRKQIRRLVRKDGKAVPVSKVERKGNGFRRSNPRSTARKR